MWGGMEEVEVDTLRFLDSLNFQVVGDQEVEEGNVGVGVENWEEDVGVWGRSKQ